MWFVQLKKKTWGKSSRMKCKAKEGKKTRNKGPRNKENRTIWGSDKWVELGDANSGESNKPERLVTKLHGYTQ